MSNTSYAKMKKQDASSTLYRKLSAQFGVLQQKPLLVRAGGVSISVVAVCSELITSLTVRAGVHGEVGALSNFLPESADRCLLRLLEPDMQSNKKQKAIPKESFKSRRSLKTCLAFSGQFSRAEHELRMLQEQLTRRG